jgi:HEAT repeat protein
MQVNRVTTLRNIMNLKTAVSRRALMILPVALIGLLVNFKDPSALADERTVRLRIEQDGLIQFDFYGFIGGLLKEAGLEVVGSDAKNHGSALEIEVGGQALSQRYSFYRLGPGTEYYTGASVRGTILLEKGKRVYAKDFQGRKDPPSSISGWGGPTSSSGAPYKEAFLKSNFFEVLGDLLGECWGSDAEIRYYIGGLKNPVLESQQSQAIDRLVKIGRPSIELLIPMLKASGRVKPEATTVIRRIGKPALEPLLTALKDRDPDIRKIAVEGLAGLGDTQAVEPLAVMLKAERESNVRQTVVTSLGEMGPTAIAPLAATLKDEDPEIRKNAIRALEKIGDSGAVEPLVSMLRGEREKGIRQMAIASLGKMGPSAVAPLIVALKDEDPEIRRNAIWALEKIGDPRAVEPLVSMLEREREASIRQAVVVSLGKMGPPAIKPLITALKERDHTVRKSAAEALGNIRDRQAVKPLIMAMQGEPLSVRRSISDALQAITGQNFGLDNEAWTKWWEEQSNQPK